MIQVYTEHVYPGLDINEDFFEQTLIEHLVEKHGYEFLHGPDVARSTSEYRDVFLPGVLPAALARINKELPNAAIQEAILKLSNIEGGNLEQRNETFTDYLQSGVEVRYFDGKRSATTSFAYSTSTIPRATLFTSSTNGPSSSIRRNGPTLFASSTACRSWSSN